MIKPGFLVIGVLLGLLCAWQLLQLAGEMLGLGPEAFWSMLFGGGSAVAIRAGVKDKDSV